MHSIQFFKLVENSCLLVSAPFSGHTIVWESLKGFNFLLAKTWMVNLCLAILQFLWLTGSMGYCLWIEKGTDLGTIPTCKSDGWSLTAFGPGGAPLARPLWGRALTQHLQLESCKFNSAEHSSPGLGSSGPGTENWHCLVCTTLRTTRAQQVCKQGNYPVKSLWEII